jgi:large subunit ribosomal protein L32
MAVPKKKSTPSRRNMRRLAGASNKLAVPTLSTCPGCGEVVRPHTICTAETECSQYAKRFATSLYAERKAAADAKKAPAATPSA